MTSEPGPSGRAHRNFTVVPNGALAADIKPTALKVYIALRSFLRPGHATYPHIQTVCDMYNIPERTFNAALKELQDAGLLIVQKHTYSNGFRRSNEYFFPDIDDAILPVGPANLALPQPADLADPEPAIFALPKEEEKSEEETSLKPTRKRVGQTTIPRGWAPTEATLIWAKEKHPRIDVSRETVNFIKYFLAKGTRYTDWQQAFRNWMDRAAERNQPSASRRLAVVQPPATLDLDPYGEKWV